MENFIIDAKLLILPNLSIDHICLEEEPNDPASVLLNKTIVGK